MKLKYAKGWAESSGWQTIPPQRNRRVHAKQLAQSVQDDLGGFNRS
ncbi:MAG TPA: hypothetical protein VFC07_10215 [Verrucomicrobiae bacterium]|nr:hypothetical protein [Verrucomicrobiae bacterium]